MRKLGYDYHDPKDQTSCTAWNYYASATSNVAAQAAVAVRNFAAAEQTGYFPLIHCGTSYGHYKEVREELILHPELRAEVREIMGKLGKQLVLPEEIVHYSEWLYAMRHEIAAKQVRDFSNVKVTVHPACHYYKLVEGDAIYDPDVYGGQRTAVVTGLAQRLGAEVREYSTWFDCCGFGFRHILVQRDFTRSFATLRKIEVMKEEADPDVVLTHDTGCVTTLDKSQFAAQAHDRNVGVAVHERGPVRRPGHGRPPVQGLPAALALGRLPAVAGEDGHRLGEGLGGVPGGRRPARARREALPGLGRRRLLTGTSSTHPTRPGGSPGHWRPRGPMPSDAVLVIGGGPAGLRAAMESPSWASGPSWWRSGSSSAAHRSRRTTPGSPRAASRPSRSCAGWPSW